MALNRNVKLVLFYVTVLSMYSSLVSQTPLSAYILLLRPNDYTSVGVVSGIQGCISLVIAFPVGALSDRIGRQKLLRLAAVVGLVTAAYMAAVLLTLGEELERAINDGGSGTPLDQGTFRSSDASLFGGGFLQRNRRSSGGSSGGGSGGSISSGSGGSGGGGGSSLGWEEVSTTWYRSDGSSVDGVSNGDGAVDLMGDTGSGERGSGDHEHEISNELYYALCGSSALWGLFMGLHAAPLEALFADSIASGRRSGLYVLRSSLRTLGGAIGPLLSIFAFLREDSWTREQLSLVILLGLAGSVPPAVVLFLFRDASALGEESEALHVTRRPAPVGSRSPAPNAALVALLAAHPEPGCGPFRREHIAPLVAAADTFQFLGSGMTVRFFALFFWQKLDMHPIAVNAVYAGGPVGIAAMAMLMQRLSRRLGRATTAIMCRVSSVREPPCMRCSHRHSPLSHLGPRLAFEGAAPRVREPACTCTCTHPKARLRLSVSTRPSPPASFLSSAGDAADCDCPRHDLQRPQVARSTALPPAHVADELHIGPHQINPQRLRPAEEPRQVERARVGQSVLMVGFVDAWRWAPSRHPPPPPPPTVPSCHPPTRPPHLPILCPVPPTSLADNLTTPPMTTLTSTRTSPYPGYLIKTIGFNTTFLFTAGLQTCSIACLLPLLCLVRAEAS